jgi:hypothetical protein
MLDNRKPSEDSKEARKSYLVMKLEDGLWMRNFGNRESRRQEAQSQLRKFHTNPEV